MADIETAHYGALIRLQVTMSALQNLLGATADENAGDPGQADAIAKARDDASAAIEIALGGRHDVPERLMRNWSDNSMKRDAAKALAASAWDPNFIYDGEWPATAEKASSALQSKPQSKKGTHH